MPTNQPTPLTVDHRGYVYADGVKICYLDRQQQTLKFHDKNKHRAQQRGTNQVVVSLNDLANLAQKIDTPQDSTTIKSIPPPVKGEY